MNNYKIPSQFELFPNDAENFKDFEKSARLHKDLTLSLENIIVVCIIFVMGTVLAYSFGVERGKKTESVDSRLEAPVQSEIPLDDVQASMDLPQTQGAISSVPAATDKAAEKVKTIDLPPVEKTIDGNGNYTIQVASFKQEKSAHKEAKSLKTKVGYETFVISKGSHSIVCVGKFPHKSEASKASTKLKGLYQDLLVRRL